MDVRALLYQGCQVPATDYVNAQRLRKVLANEFRALFRSIDCLFTPATPITAPRIGQREVEIDGETLDTRLVTTRFARAFNALGFPALAMPCGETPEGMPIGLQMVGRPFEESLLFKFGEALEQRGARSQRIVVFAKLGFGTNCLGRTPWSARDARVPPSPQESAPSKCRKADKGSAAD